MKGKIHEKFKLVMKRLSLVSLIVLICFILLLIFNLYNGRTISNLSFKGFRVEFKDNKSAEREEKITPIEQKLCGALWHRGEPLQGAVVMIQEHNQRTQTDAQGRFCFTIKAAKEEKVRLMAQKEGFETLLEDATLGNTNLAYKMERKL
jgi:hypothetical protein